MQNNLERLAMRLMGTCTVAAVVSIACPSEPTTTRVDPVSQSKAAALSTGTLPVSSIPKSARVYYIDFSVRELAVGVTPDAITEASWSSQVWSGARLEQLYKSLSITSGAGSFVPSNTRLLVQPTGTEPAIAVDMDGGVRYGKRQYRLQPAAFLRCFLVLQPTLPKTYLKSHYAWTTQEGA
jgi:hypothetical protein